MKQREDSKLTTPRERRIIDRPRLLNQLEETNARTILLIAPAGYGKTTLARQWARGRSSIWWYTARPGSGDLAQVAAGLAESLDVVRPGFHAYIIELLRALSNPARQSEEIVEAFTTALGGANATMGVIDDYHFLAESTSAETLVHALQEQLGFGLLIASRVRPTWAGARQQMYGDLLEFDKEDLALTIDESKEVLGPEHSRRDSNLIVQARGWPAVIGLAALARETSEAPSDAVSTTLFRFFAELFRSIREPLREQLGTLALLPNLSPELLREAFATSAEDVVEDAIAYGFVTSGHQAPELHPLIREYLLIKLVARPDALARVEEAFRLSLHNEAWDHAFELVDRFVTTDLLDPLIETAFKPLLRSGRITTLEQISRYAHVAATHVSPLVDLIDAELAFRDGHLAKAESLATGVSRRLDLTHPLRSHAYWLAGEGAQLMFNHENATKHFREADATAQDDDDARDAIWGLVLTSLYSESPDAGNSVAELTRRRDKSPTDLVRAVTGTMQLMRYTTGLGNALDIEEALHALAAVQDPRVRTSFTNTYAYQLTLSGRYDDALGIAEQTLDEVETYQLTWARPHAHWGLAAAHIGLRQFGTAERWLQRVEQAADQLHNGHLILNAAALRARLLLTLQQPVEACLALNVDESLPANLSMRGEFLATKALALAVTGDAKGSATAADEATRFTTCVEAHAFAACAKAVLAQRSGAHSTECARWACVPARLGIWDALVCSARAWPGLLPELATEPELGLAFRSALRRSHDYELANRAGLSLGRKPRSRHSTLSPREQEVLQLVRQGLTNATIAKALFIGEATVKVHVRHILEKVGARTRTEAATRVLDD